ncbi:hypothetical protein VTI28DRAFT_1393 [Corynascus sepedonium]
MNSARPRRPASREDFEVAVICALSIEADAVEALFDHHWEDDGPSYSKARGDPNAYSTGTIGRHNVVLAHMPGMGKASAVAVAANCRSSFPNIRLALIVGVCGVIPFRSGGSGETAETVLGDVIVSDGVVQPTIEIRALLAKLKGLRSRRMLQGKMSDYMEVLRGEPELAAVYPGVAQDKLFETTYRHMRDGLSCEECACDGKLIPRARLSRGDRQPAVHFGLIASGDTVIKSGKDRDDIARETGVIGFEMESAGVWDIFPSVVIKGACDYADSHKTKAWQRYAAATAAACMKAFLAYWMPPIPVSVPILEQPTGPWFIVPYPRNESFVGRSAVLDKLKQLMLKAASQARVALYGLGGIGKTQIALEYAYQLKEACSEMRPETDDYEENLARYLPECLHGTLIITTRNKQAGSRLTKGKRIIEVGFMDDGETNQLLRAHLDGISAAPGEFSTLSSRLEHLPLALVQAAAFIQENSIDVRKYLELLDSSDQNLINLLSEESETEGRDSETPRAVAETWFLSFEQIQRQDVFARPGGQGEMQLTKALGVLKAFSLVAEEKDHGLDMHRLVQLVTQKWLAKEGRMEHFAGQALLTVSHCYPFGCYETRERLQLEAVTLREEVAGSDHPDTLTSMANLASTYRNQGRWEEAEQLGMHVLETRKTKLGANHPDTLASMNNLAFIWKYMARHRDAIDLIQNCFDLQQQVLGVGHPSTVSTRSSLEAWLKENEH